MKNIAWMTLLLLLCSLSLQAQDKRAEYYDNGKKKWEGHMDGDQKLGEWVFYHDNGQIMREGIYKNGLPYGTWKEYFRAGQLKSEGNYANGGGKSIKHGHWVWYHKNGAKSKEGHYKAGKPAGMWYEYNTLGIETSKKKL